MLSDLPDSISEKAAVIVPDIRYHRQYRACDNIRGIGVSAHSALYYHYVTLFFPEQLKRRSSQHLKFRGLVVHAFAYRHYLLHYRGEPLPGDALSVYTEMVSDTGYSRCFKSGGRYNLGIRLSTYPAGICHDSRLCICSLLCDSGFVIMSCSRDYRLGVYHCTAHAAVAALRKSCICTCGRYCRIIDRGMGGQLGYGFGIAGPTHHTGICKYAFAGAVRLFCN